MTDSRTAALLGVSAAALALASAAQKLAEASAAPPSPPPPWPLLAAQWPGFDQSTVPPIPDGWEESSWRNDACPSWVAQAEGVHIFVEHLQPSDREEPKASRFSAYMMGGEAPEWEAGSEAVNNVPNCNSDVWADVLAYVASVPKIRASAAGLAAYRKLAEAISGLNAAYDAHDLNEYQPPHVQGVIPMSIDEWAGEAWSCVRAWEAQAEGREPLPFEGMVSTSYAPESAEEAATAQGGALQEVRRLALYGHGTVAERLGRIRAALPEAI